MRASLRAALAVSAVTLFAAYAAPAKATPIAELSFTSQPGDPVGQGQSFDFNYDTSLFPAVILAVGPISGAPVDVSFALEVQLIHLGPPLFVTAVDTATLEFETTNTIGIPLEPGTYTDAVYPFVTDHPGFEFSFDGNACTAATGSFTVTDAEFTGYTIDQFDATFVQQCNGSTGALTGTFDYSATGFSIPEPAALPVLFSGLAVAGLFIGFQRRRSNPIA